MPNFSLYTTWTGEHGNCFVTPSYATGHRGDLAKRILNLQGVVDSAEEVRRDAVKALGEYEQSGPDHGQSIYFFGRLSAAEEILHSGERG